MASFRKRGKSWLAEVRRGGVHEYASFPTKAEAQEWAAELERKIRQGRHTIAHKRTLGDLLERYANEVTPRKGGRQWELTRIAWIQRQTISSYALTDLSASVIAAWRDSRLTSVTGETIRRDMALLSHALSVATREWGWLSENPMSKVRRPQGNPHRERLATDDEMARICHVAGYSVGGPLETLTQRVAAAFLFAVETGMRGGEICALRREDVRLDLKFVHVRRGKSRAAKRDVPLSDKAKKILADVYALGLDPVWGMRQTQKDAIFRKIRAQAGIDGLHFHDARHTAITRLSRKLDVLALARIVGHQDLSMLRRYYNESAEELAKRL